jgi:exonuclease SbcD
VLRYSGSPLRYSFSEQEHLKSVSLVDLDPDLPARVTAVPVRQPRAMSELTGPLAELLADDRQVEDWVRLIVTDRSRPDQLFERVKSHFPHVLQVLHQPAGARPAGASAPAAALAQSPRQLGADFVQHVTGLDALDLELDLFEQAYQVASTAEARLGGD